MASTLTITIPWTPTLALSPNQSHRPRWVTSKAKREAAYDAHNATLDALSSLTEDVHLPEVVPYRVIVSWGKGRKPWDDDNLIASLKAAIDSMCAVIGIDDKHLRLTGIGQVRDPRGIGHTTFIFGQEETS